MRAVVGKIQSENNAKTRDECDKSGDKIQNEKSDAVASNSLASCCAVYFEVM